MHAARTKLQVKNSVGDVRVRPGAATWRTGRNIRVFFDSDVIRNTESTQRVALPSDADRPSHGHKYRVLKIR